MKVTLPDIVIKTLESILNENIDKPQNIRIYFAGVGCGGPSFGIALDEQEEDDLEYNLEGLHFIMSSDEYNKYGDMIIEDTGFGFVVRPESIPNTTGCIGCTDCN